MWNLTSHLSNFRLASFGLPSVDSIDGHRDRIQSWRYGEVELSNGELVALYPRWWPRVGSQWESWQDSYHRTLPTDWCRAYYAFPRRAPGFMSVLYARSGPGTQYKTISRAVSAMDEIARIRDSQAIVCQMVSERGTERLMKRWGYVRHAFSLGDNHYIKRLR
ncbi:MAG: hypothetical protein NTY15_21640 [Planctomycetota bacterium]|nr:hypothetical protein [Planctomycetota bacterium]